MNIIRIKYPFYQYCAKMVTSQHSAVAQLMHKNIQKCLRSYSSSSNKDPELEEFLSQLRSDFKEMQSQSEESNHDHNISEEEKLNITHELADTWKEINRKNYNSFDITNSRIIYDSIEEEMGLADIEEPAVEEVEESPPIEMKRGKNGVFDLDQLVDLLKFEKSKDLVTIKIPEERKYADHMVIVSALSQKHLDSIAMSVRKYYLKLKNKSDDPVILEGKGTKWIAIDLDNIILHIMAPSTREKMDLESLWLLGPENDPKTRAIEGEELYSPFQYDLDDPSFIIEGEEDSNKLFHLEGDDACRSDSEDSTALHPDLTTNDVYKYFTDSVSER